MDGESTEELVPAFDALFVAKAAHELRGAVGGLGLLADAVAARVDRLQSTGATVDTQLASVSRQLADQTAELASLLSELLDLSCVIAGRRAEQRVQR